MATENATESRAQPNARLERIAVAVPSRRWARLAWLLLGGTAESLVHDSRCSLVVVPHPHDET
jgi:nucleotide-binding universal stress UspA family protein